MADTTEREYTITLRGIQGEYKFIGFVDPDWPPEGKFTRYVITQMPSEFHDEVIFICKDDVIALRYRTVVAPTA